MTLKRIYKLSLIMAGGLILTPLLDDLFDARFISSTEGSFLAIIGLVLLIFSEAIKTISKRLDKLECE